MGISALPAMDNQQKPGFGAKSTYFTNDNFNLFEENDFEFKEEKNIPQICPQGYQDYLPSPSSFPSHSSYSSSYSSSSYEEQDGIIETNQKKRTFDDSLEEEKQTTKRPRLDFSTDAPSQDGTVNSEEYKADSPASFIYPDTFLPGLNPPPQLPSQPQEMAPYGNYMGQMQAAHFQQPQPQIMNMPYGGYLEPILNHLYPIASSGVQPNYPVFHITYNIVNIYNYPPTVPEPIANPEPMEVQVPECEENDDNEDADLSVYRKFTHEPISSTYTAIWLNTLRARETITSKQTAGDILKNVQNIRCTPVNKWRRLNIVIGNYQYILPITDDIYDSILDDNIREKIQFILEKIWNNNADSDRQQNNFGAFEKVFVVDIVKSALLGTPTDHFSNFLMTFYNGIGTLKSPIEKWRSTISDCKTSPLTLTQSIDSPLYPILHLYCEKSCTNKQSICRHYTDNLEFLLILEKLPEWYHTQVSKFLEFRKSNFSGLPLNIVQHIFSFWMTPLLAEPITISPKQLEEAIEITSQP